MINVAANQIDLAAQCIKEGNLVIFPTETVYGLGADALNADAVAKIYEAKQRPQRNPIIVHISNNSWLDELAYPLNKIEQKLVKTFWPGPMTIVLERKSIVPDIISAGKSTVAVRFPNDKTALKLIKYSKTPIAAPSANISGKVSPTKFEDIDPVLAKKVCAGIDGGQCRHGLESTVIIVTDNIVKILRPGAITLEMISSLGLSVEYATDAKNVSPGTHFKHYSPATKISLIPRSKYIDLVMTKAQGDMSNIAAIGCDEYLQKITNQQNIKKISLGSLADLNISAAKLFAALQKLDKSDVIQGFIHDFPTNGIGKAIMDRLNRAVKNH